MSSKYPQPDRSTRRNDPVSLALFLCAYSALLAFILFS